MKQAIANHAEALSTEFTKNAPFRRTVIAAGMLGATVVAAAAVSVGGGLKIIHGDAYPNAAATSNPYEGHKKIHSADLAACNPEAMQEEKPLDGPRQNAAMLELSYDASDNIPRPFTGDVEGEWHDAATFVDQYIAKQGGFAPTDYRVRTVLWYTPETSPAKAQADADQIEAAAVEHLHVLPDSLEPPYTPTYVQPMNPELNIEGHNLVTVIVERAPVCPV